MKKQSLAFGIFALALVAVDYFNLQTMWCDSLSCKSHTISVLQGWFFLAVLGLFFSLILFAFPRRVAKSWWRFARWAIPIIFIISTLILMGVHHAPHGHMQDVLDMPAVILLLVTFALVSLIKIAQSYYQRN